jgi:hypothetical protein
LVQWSIFVSEVELNSEKAPSLMQRAEDWFVNASDFLFDAVPNQKIECGDFKVARSGHNVTAENGSEIEAQDGSNVLAKSGAKVNAESGATVVAMAGSDVTYHNGSYGVAEVGAQYKAEPGANVVEVTDIQPFLSKCAVRPRH